jgi:hypothetical protein
MSCFHAPLAALLIPGHRYKSDEWRYDKIAVMERSPIGGGNAGIGSFPLSAYCRILL